MITNQKMTVLLWSLKLYYGINLFHKNIGVTHYEHFHSHEVGIGNNYNHKTSMGSLQRYYK